MEHLLPPGVVAPIEVSFVTPPEDLLPNDHETMIEALITSDSSISLDFIVKTQSRKLCHLLQSELWTSLLALVLDLDAVAQDFVRDGGSEEVILTTSSLEKHLNAWRDQVHQLDEDTKNSMRNGIYAMLQQYAIGLHNLAASMARSDSTFFSTTGTRTDEEDDKLGRWHFACVVLHQALCWAGSRVLGFPFSPGSPLSLRSYLPWLKVRMKSDGWCPYTLWRLYEVSDIDEWALGYSLGTRRTNQDHSCCTETECLSNAMSEDDEPKHTETNCSCPILHAPEDQMVRVIEEGDIPILQIKKTPDGALTFKTYKLSGGCKYIALSHVWADGLGCAKSNSITTCQLDRILDRLLKLDEREHCGELCVWIDTLCIPVSHEFQSLRESQIVRMREIYKGAFCVLALDPDFLKMSDDPGITEIGMRLYMSAWCSRLWTYQEGCHARKVFLMSKDGLVDVDRAIKEQRGKSDDEAALTSNLADYMTRSIVFSLGRPHYDSSPAESFDAADFYAILDRLREEGDNDAQKMLYAIRDRSSSRPDDEAVIIAASLGIDTLSVLKVPPEQRMTALIKAMPKVPANMIFTMGPRISCEGFRWAPMSLLRSKGSLPCGPISDLVPMSLDDLKSGDRTVRLMSKLDSQGRGLITFNPAVRLEKIAMADDAFVFELLGRTLASSFADKEQTWEKRDSEPMLQLARLLGERRKIAILLHEFNPTDKMSNGIVIEMLSETRPLEEQGGDSNATKSRFIGAVSFHSAAQYDMTLGEGETERLDIQAEWLSPRFWLVD